MMENKLKIAVIVGTTRKGRQTIKASRLVEEVGKTINNVSITFVDIKNHFPFKGEGNDEESIDKDLAKIIKEVDAYFIVAPEYNHSFPGSLKMLLDNSLKNFNKKAVAIAGVSSGNFGGARMAENLLSVLRAVGLYVIYNDIYFSNVNQLFDGSKESNALLEIQKERILKSFQELIWLAKALKTARENTL